MAIVNPIVDLRGVELKLSLEEAIAVLTVLNLVSGNNASARYWITNVASAIEDCLGAAADDIDVNGWSGEVHFEDESKTSVCYLVNALRGTYEVNS